MEDTGARSRPDGSAWREAQRETAARNDETQRRGREQRAETERRQAAKLLASQKRGVYR